MGAEWIEYRVSGTRRKNGEHWASPPKRLGRNQSERALKDQADSLARDSDDVRVMTRRVTAGDWVDHYVAPSPRADGDGAA